MIATNLSGTASSRVGGDGSSLADEELFNLAEAATFYPTNRGKRPHRNSLWRHATRGVRGVKLETLMTPSGPVTSRGAVLRFFAALTAQQRGEAISTRTPNQRNRASEAAARELEKLGI